MCRYAPEEFVKALTASGVYTDAEARKEFNRMDADDNKKIDIKEFTVWYVAMDDIGACAATCDGGTVPTL